MGRSEIRLAADVFRAFDKNHDEALDSVELMEFLDTSDPAIELIVRLGPRPPGPGAADKTLQRRGGRPPERKSGFPVRPRVRLLRSDETVVTIEVGDVRIDVRTVDTSWDPAQAPDL